MASGRLTVQVLGREALPVRAIAYVTGWNWAPDDVAKNLARRAGEPFAVLHDVSAFHLQGQDPITVLPKEWDAIVARLAALEARLHSEFSNNDLGYAAWRESAPLEIPPGVFVWLDEFEAACRHDFSEYRLSYIDERPGERELNYCPMMTQETRRMVMEGFDHAHPADVVAPVDHVKDRKQAEKDRNAAETEAAYIETYCNGQPIKWSYWVRKMPTLTASQAARLMSGLDPDLFEILTSRPTKNDPEPYCARARDIQRLAETEGIGPRSPRTWLQWAEERGEHVHPGFRIEVDSTGMTTGTGGDPVTAPSQGEETPTMRRATHDVTRERGCRRKILENWEVIEELHGTGADARQVLRVLKRNADHSERTPALKTVQNSLIALRKEGLIP